MTIQESAKVIYMLHTAYPADRKATAEELADRIDLWAVFFADYTAQEVERATKAWILGSPFMPNPNEIKARCDTWRKTARLLSNAKWITPDGPEPEPSAEDVLLANIWDSVTQTANEADL